MITRRTAIKIKDGHVQHKDRNRITADYWTSEQKDIQIDSEKPGKGYKHFLKIRDIKMFIDMLPNHDEIDTKFRAVLLAEGGDADGWYYNGVIAICAWEKSMTRVMNLWYFNEHKDILDRLGVRYEKSGRDMACYFTENQIKAFQLLHVFLHEIGHHHDRIHTKSQLECSNGEPYAENYALEYEDIIWNKFFETFQL